MTVILNTQKDKFFIALGKQHDHSFVMFGVYDQNKVRRLLCRVGKHKYEPDDEKTNIIVKGVRNLSNFFFSSVKAKLGSEPIYKKKPCVDPISYQAYEATYEQYLELIGIIEGVSQKKRPIWCFKPYDHNDDYVLLTEKNSRVTQKTDHHKEIKDNVESLSVSNTCRHTAIRLVEEVLKTPLSPSISSRYFVDFLCKTQLVHGVPSSDIPFYVLPIPPNQFTTQSPAHQDILKKLYARMEHLITLDPNSVATMEKFNSIKAQYNQLAGSPALSLEQLLESIQSWKERDKALLSTLRKTYIWDFFLNRSSATMDTVNEIESSLKNDKNGLK
ncbi:hypothetical protein [Legionella worsleiensis]|uniref:Uncharacterized protein n=1 Tax=Legionella worsleiensis TaxID=45076 RepID=A0A0W1A8Z2_9GAMM|nr:hypothetical protein [Legionella worsleiensis]KTD77836.1 hypothetical protein Lwor_1718 [Legionella worsleiensis]STY33078.1 Uncharacterised protein [Legionella worsleiensis]